MTREEQWKDIDWFVEYKGCYCVSNFGNVKNKKTGKPLKPFLDDKGYYMVKLQNNKTKKTIKVHKLVAMAFIKNPNKYNVVNHIDENKKNNKAENLEWCTQKYNCNYSLTNYINGMKTRTNTGERYISYIKRKSAKQKFVVNFRQKKKYKQKMFYTLQEAIDFRNYYYINLSDEQYKKSKFVKCLIKECA